MTISLPKVSHDPDFLVGVDLGQARDFTAIVVGQRFEELTGEFDREYRRWQTETRYEVRHIERPPLGTSYPAIVERLGEILAGLKPPRRATLTVDATGVGRPVVELMYEAGLDPWPITITGGLSESWSQGAANVPKRVLVSNLSILFGTGRLRISKQLAEAELLVKELQNFKMKISAAGNDSYEAWREGDHDDLVLATALACWWGEKRLGSILELPRMPEPPPEFRHPTWNEAFAEHCRRLGERPNEKRWA